MKVRVYNPMEYTQSVDISGFGNVEDKVIVNPKSSVQVDMLDKQFIRLKKKENSLKIYKI